MAITEREVHIKNLIALKDFCNNNGVFTLASNIEQSLDYAISSLKTDLKYDLMYEGVNVYTEDEVKTMLEELQLEIKELWDSSYDIWLDTQYYIGKSDTLGEVDEIIQQKITSLKEAT